MNKIKRMLTIDLIKYYIHLRELESNPLYGNVEDRISDVAEELTERASRNDEQAFQYVSYRIFI